MDTVCEMNKYIRIHDINSLVRIPPDHIAAKDFESNWCGVDVILVAKTSEQKPEVLKHFKVSVVFFIDAFSRLGLVK